VQAVSDFNLRRIDIRYLAVTASLLISFLMRVFPSSLNDDSYVYIRTAQIFLDQGIEAAVSHYSWPVFSILIALVSKIGLNLFSSAFLISSLFFALLTFALLSIVKVIDSDRTTLAVAAVCILVFPELNEYRSMIIRDVAFWSLLSFSLWQLLLYTKYQLLTHCIGFSASLILATAFRVEALAYLIVIPLVHIIFTSTKELRKPYYKLFYVSGLILFFLTISLLAFKIDVVAQIVDIVSKYQPFIESLTSSNLQRTQALSVAIFGKYAANYSNDFVGVFIISGLFSLLIVKIIIGIGAPLFFFVIAKPTGHRVKIDRSTVLTLSSYFFVNFSIVTIFIFVTRYLPGRHTMVLSLVVLIFISLLVKNLLYSPSTWKPLLIRAASCFLLFYCATDSYYSFGHKKNYISDAVQWLDQTSPSSQILLTNNHAIAYKSGRVKNYDQVPRNLSGEEILDVEESALLVVEMNSSMNVLMAQLIDNGVIHFEIGFPTGEEPRIAIYSKARN
jgi:hypothetical protein